MPAGKDKHFEKRDQRVADPTLGPDWRFARVMAMIAHHPQALRCKPRDDEYVRVMRRFMLEFQRDADRREEASVEFPGPFMALKIHDDEAPETRVFLECRLLAGQTDDEIAERLGTTPETVFWYATMFFAVRERLRQQDWIFRHVLGTAQRRNLMNIESPLKLVAYFGGPIVLDFMISGFRASDRPRSVEEIDRFVAETVRSGACRRAALAVPSVDLDKVNFRQLLDICRQFQAEPNSGGGSAHDELLEGIHAMISDIKFLNGDPAIEELSKSAPELLRFDSVAAELRDSELYDAVAERTEGLDPLLRMVMPEPRSHVHEEAQKGV